jgi:hypothetical protein
MKYAASKGIPFAAILGADEIARGEVAVKNLGTGAQSSMPRAQVPGFVKRPLPNPNPNPNPNRNPAPGTPNPEP